MREHEIEPVHGLPEQLPTGEGILWQGSPAWWPLARRALHLKGLALYFLVLIAWRIASAMADGGTAAEVAMAPLMSVGLAALCLGVLALIVGEATWRASSASVPAMPSLSRSRLSSAPQARRRAPTVCR